MDAIQEVAEAAAKRKAQIREWAAKQVDPSLVVTETKDPEVIYPQEEQPDPGPADEIAVEDEQNKLVPTDVPDPGPADEVVEEDEDAPQEVEGDQEEDSTADAKDDTEDDAEEAPAESANKGEWVAYRMKTHNLTEDEANEQTKAQLIALD